jgi:hypothetical protein
VGLFNPPLHWRRYKNVTCVWYDCIYNINWLPSFRVRQNIFKSREVKSVNKQVLFGGGRIEQRYYVNVSLSLISSTPQAWNLFYQVHISFMLLPPTQYTQYTLTLIAPPAARVDNHAIYSLRRPAAAEPFNMLYLFMHLTESAERQVHLNSRALYPDCWCIKQQREKDRERERVRVCVSCTFFRPLRQERAVT